MAPSTAASRNRSASASASRPAFLSRITSRTQAGRGRLPITVVGKRITPDPPRGRLTLEGAAREPADEVALHQEVEHDGWRREEDGGREDQLHRRRQLADERGEPDGGGPENGPLGAPELQVELSQLERLVRVRRELDVLLEPVVLVGLDHEDPGVALE